MSDLPNGWCPVSLKSIATIVSGVGFPKKYQGIQNEYYPVYKVKDVSHAYLLNNALLNTAGHTVSKDIAKLMKGKIFKEGTTVFAKIGEALKLNRRVFLSKEGLADNNVMGVKPELDDMNTYIFRYLQLFNIASLSRSTTVPSIRKSDVEGILVNLPPLNEQIRIANKLDSLLGKLEATQKHLDKIPTLLNRFRQSVLAAAVSGDLIEISDYEKLNLGDVSIVQTGSTPLKSNISYYKNGTIHWLTSTVTGQQLVTSADKFVTELAVKECRLKVFPKGTLLIAMYGEGKTRGQVTEIAIDATINQACAAITVNESLASKSYIKICIENNYEYTRLMAEGGAQPNLNLTKVRAIPVTLPSTKKQSEIVHQVETLFKLADKVEQQYQAAKQRTDKLTQSILAKAFRGELVPQDPNDEPASELLKRIQLNKLKFPNYFRDDDREKPFKLGFAIFKANPTKMITLIHCEFRRFKNWETSA